MAGFIYYTPLASHKSVLLWWRRFRAKEMPCCIHVKLWDFTVLKIHLSCTFEQPRSKMYSSNVALPKLLIERWFDRWWSDSWEITCFQPIWVSLRIFGVEKADAFAAPVYYHLSQYIPISLLGLYNLGRFGLRVGDITREAVHEEEHDPTEETGRSWKADDREGADYPSWVYE